MGTTTINCPNCGAPIAIEEVLKHQVEKQLLASERKKYEEQLVKLREEMLREAKSSVKAELEFKLKNTEEENQEVKHQNEKLQKDMLQLTKQLRQTLATQDEYRLKMEKERLIQLEEERKRAREVAQQETALDYQRRIEEMQKKLSDAVKAKDELSRKLEQGSQQTQGEVVELKLEETLRSAFPHDTIESIGKGVRGADVRQIVKSPGGTICGVILWESKQTKHFDEKWIPKLKEDLRLEKADLPAIVTNVYGESGWSGMSQNSGVWICSFQLLLPLASLLRKTLIEVARQKFVGENKGEKATLVYDYVTGVEFRQQIQAMAEVYREMNEQIRKERTAFEKSWKQREGQLQRLFSGTAGIYGSLQGRAGQTAIPEIKGLELLELTEGN